MIKYDYTYSGRKIKELTTENGATTGTRFYAGPFVFSSFSTTEPEWVNMPYGRFVYKDATAKWKPEFHLKDHLGNTRMAILSDATVTQENYYYPFGMLERSGNPARAGRISSLSLEPFSLGADRNRYTYNGKEFNSDFGLNWHDYGARMYDAQIGRWHSVDPLAEKLPNWTPYRYALNNPLRYIDPTGMLEDDYGLDKDGYITPLRETNDKTDKLIALDDKGVETDKSIEVEKGLLQGLATEREGFTVNIYPTGEQQGSYGETTNIREGRQVFKFTSDNTDVEWSYQEFKDGRIVVSTGHNCCTTTQGFDAPGYNWLDLKIDVHSHPGSDPAALNPRNGTDIGRANHLRNAIPGVKVMVYIPLMPGNNKLFNQ